MLFEYVIYCPALSCRLAMAAGPAARLYTATHQVLYLHLVARFRCEVAATARGLARDKCAAVLGEAAQLHAALAAMASADRLDHCTADLWLEQSGTQRSIFTRGRHSEISTFSHILWRTPWQSRIFKTCMAQNNPIYFQQQLQLHQEVSIMSLE